MRWSDIQFSPSERTLRQFAVLCLIVFGALGGFELYAGERLRFAAVYVALAIGLGGVGLVRPRVVRPLFVGWSVVAFPIGWALSTLVLAVLFYGLFTPIGLVFRLSGRDLLHLRRRDVQTYWAPKQSVTSPREYFRQS